MGTQRPAVPRPSPKGISKPQPKGSPCLELPSWPALGSPRDRASGQLHGADPARGQWGSQQRQGAGQAGPQEPSHHPLQAHHSSSFQQRGPALAEATRSPMSECAQAPSTQEFSSTSQEAEDLPGAGRGEGAERAGTCQCQPRRLCSQALNEA